MNEWINDWLNEWMDEWLNEWINEWDTISKVKLVNALTQPTDVVYPREKPTL